MPFDLFISYSRKDNLNNRVTELKNQIEADYLEFTKEPLNCFFDQEEIKGMDDWQHRLLQGLKDSHLLLVILSPNYLASLYCEWEIVEYLKYEYSRGVAGDGVAQVYFMEIPGIDDEGFRAQAAQWLEKVSRRQRIDLRPWHDEGADSLKRLDVKKRLEELKESLRKRITRMRVISEVPGNLPAPNPRFVGREREMEMLHKATALGQLGVITAVHGVGGLGKTAIAFQYAYAYANFYPGGRWYLGCANETSLASVIKRLDADLDITLTEDEKKDDTRGAKRVLNELYNRAVKNAEKANIKSKSTTSDKESIKPAVLLILDNVDHPELIQPPCSDIISGKEWLKILVTTRLGPEELGEDETTQQLLSIDELPFDDGVSLIESYQPCGRFQNNEEKEKAGEIVKLLGGFTLAVEVAALYLYEKKGRVSCAEFLEILKAKGVDFAGENTKKQLSHTKLISATLAPTLDSLSPEETLILSYASILPPDSIPLPWLKSLVTKEYPQLDEIDMAGIDNPWISTINHLLSLRLFQLVELDTDSNFPRIVRIHRLVQNETGIRIIYSKEKLLNELTEYIFERAKYFHEGWLNKATRWEIEPVKVSAHLWLEKGLSKGSDIANWIHSALKSLGNYQEAKKLLIQALASAEKNYELGHPTIAMYQSNLAGVLHYLGELQEAKKLQIQALASAEKNFKPGHPSIASEKSNLALIQISLGEFQEAKILLIQALESDQKNFEPAHPSIAIRQSNLAILYKRLGEFQEAKKLLIQALESAKKNFEPGHHTITDRQSILAMVYRDLGELQEAKKMLIQAIESAKKNFEPEYLHIARHQSNLALVHKDLGELQEAKKMMINALESALKIFEPGHPDLAIFQSNLAFAYKDLGELEEAKKLLIQALESTQKKFEPWHASIAKSHGNLAIVEEALGNLKEAEGLYRVAHQTWLNSLPKGHPYIRQSFSILINILKKTGQFQEAKELQIQALEHEQEGVSQSALQ